MIICYHLSHYRKANIPAFTDQHNVGRVIRTYYDEYIKPNKINKENNNAQNAVIISFQSDLEKMMRLYPNSLLKDMVASKKVKTCREIDAIDNDTEFMKSMMSDRKASYSRSDKVVTKYIEQREERDKKKSSTLMQQYAIEEHCMDFTSSSSESKDIEVQEEEMDF